MCSTHTSQADVQQDAKTRVFPVPPCLPGASANLAVGAIAAETWTVPRTVPVVAVQELPSSAASTRPQAIPSIPIFTYTCEGIGDGQVD